MLARLKHRLARSASMLLGYATHSGIILPLDQSLMSRRVQKSIMNSKYESLEAHSVQLLLRPGDVVLELGAGIGFLSAYLRRHTKVGRIVCYEANPELIPHIIKTHAINGIDDIDVRHGVVLAPPTKRTVPFYIRRDLWASSLSPEGLPAIRVVDVPAVAWADIISEVQPTALIMDIEGGEADLLGFCDLSPIKRIVVEVHPALCGVSGMARMYSALDRQGFRNVSALDGGNVLALECATVERSGQRDPSSLQSSVAQ
jgi:FkbM family methyltransferase